jgi:Carboxypeptidase regulatory-like domain
MRTSYRAAVSFRRLLALAFGVFLLGLVTPVPSLAQEVTAAINGTVTDPSGAAIAGAKVTATDQERGTAWPTVTNGDGFYNFPRLPIGTYTLKVENQGFQSAQRSDIALQLNQRANIDFQMKVGQMSETVTVTEAPPLLQTETTQLSTVIDARTNTQLPLATRNYVQLTLLSPGSVHPDPQGFANGQTTANSARPYINGNREQTNNFLLDGVDNNQVSDNLVGYAPQPDAIQEFNLISQNAAAEFGNFMGGIVNVSIKSGSNSFHGDVYEFFRNDKLNANQWSNNFNGTPRPLLRWNEFGGTLGGPIKKDKLFFFVDYQGERFDTPASTSAYTVLTAAERAGNFSQLLSQGYQLKNPVTGAIYPGNIIPPSQLSPVALKIVNSQYYPQPTNGNLVNNALNSVRTAINGDQGDARVDYAITDKDHLFGRYSQSMIDNPTLNSQPLAYNSFSTTPVHNGVLDWTRTLTPALVNDARIGVNYVFINNGNTPPSGLGNLAQTFGIVGAPSDILPAQDFTANAFAAGPNGGVAIGSANVTQLFANTVIEYQDTAIWTKGSHTMRFGFQGYRQRVDTYYSGNNGAAGTFTYDGRYSGRADSDFMLGLPAQVGSGINEGTWGQRGNVFGGYFQDDWHAKNNLIVNLGLRYEIHTPWVEVYDRQTNFGLFSGQVEQPGQNGNSRALYNTYNGIGNWQPRIGLAWTPGGGKTVIRAAYTLSSYLEGTGTNLRLTLNPPFGRENLADYTNLPYPGSTLDQGFAPLAGGSGCTEAALLAYAPSCFSAATIRLWDPNVRPAQSNQWNFTVQRQFGNSTTAQVGYVGQKVSHLMVAMPYLQRFLLPNGTTVNSPYLSGNPTLQGEIGQISGTASTGNQSYNALQATIQKRLSAGLAFQFNYTWSKCETDSIGYYGAGGQAAPTSAYWQNLYDRKAEWGPCYYDVTHIFSGYVSYDLPFGRNRMIGKNMNRVVDAFVGGWQVNAIPSWHGGFPMTITAPDQSGTKSRGARANCIAPPVVFGTRDAPAALGGGYQWFDPSSYAPPTSGFGTCGVGTVRGPGLHTVDLSVSKHFNIVENQNLEIRGEFLNVSNTPILNAPSRSIGSTLGRIGSSQGARNIQLGLKYNF